MIIRYLVTRNGTLVPEERTPKQKAAEILDDAIVARLECLDWDMFAPEATESERQAIMAQLIKYQERIDRVLAAGLG